MNYHPVTKEITNLLTQHTIPFTAIEHTEVRTSEEANKARDGFSLSQGAKALILRAKHKNGVKSFIMCVLPADRRLDNSKLKKELLLKDVRFATEEEVSQVTGGVQVGGVPPFGNLFQLAVYADPLLFKNDVIVFNAGDRRYSISMKANDYKKIVQPEIISFSG